MGKPESVTKKRVLQLFREELGYRYLGDWSHRKNNSNIEEGLLSDYLTKSGYTVALRLEHLGQKDYRKLQTERFIAL